MEVVKSKDASITSAGDTATCDSTDIPAGTSNGIATANHKLNGEKIGSINSSVKIKRKVEVNGNNSISVITDEKEKPKPKKKKTCVDSVPDQLVDMEAEYDKEPGSIERGDEAFEWLISPIDVSTFYKEHWEKQPLHIARDDPSFCKSVFSTKAMEKIVREQVVLYGKNMNVTSYDGKRETHDPEGRVYPAVMWDYYNNGCSLRFLNPQTFHTRVWKLCSTLQDHFQSMVGANVYLTPPGTQGFAPHWDDVEVFLLQLEGKKHWKLHSHRTPEEKLSRFSSKNLDQSDVGPPMMELDLSPGDLLYLPRGTIHQGNCLPDHHSLHITFSCYQLNSWSDFLQKLLPEALNVATQEDVEFRTGLPRDYLLNMGVANSDKDTPARNTFLEKTKLLIEKLFNYAPVDEMVDQLGKRLMHDVLPPLLEPDEKARCVIGDGETWNSKKSAVVNRVEIDPDTQIRLIRSTAVRLVTEDNTVRLYFSTENSREYHQVEEQFLEIGEELAPAVEFLVTSYPEYVKVEQLPVADLMDRMKVAGDLWEKNLIMTSEPLDSKYDDP